MKKSLCIVLAFAVVLISCAIGFSAFAGTNSLTIVEKPDKLYYLSTTDEIDVKGAKLKVDIDGEKTTLDIDENIKRSGSLNDADPTTTSAPTTAETTTEAPKTETTSAATTTETTTETTTASGGLVPAAKKSARAAANVKNVKVYYNTPLKTGENIVVFKYEDKTASYSVYVDSDPVKNIEVIKHPDKTSYFYGYDNDKDIDLSGLEIKVTFNKCGGTKEESYVYRYNDVKSLYFMGYKFDMRFTYQLMPGDNEVLVTYMNKQTAFNLTYVEIKVGDVNDDGVVNAADLVRLARIVINKEDLPYNSLTTDIETDGKINQKDLNRLKEMLTMPDTTGRFEWIWDAQLLSYKVAGNPFTDGYFYTDGDPWQRNFGFNAFYDVAAPYACMYYDTFRVYFEYGTYADGTPKEWLLQGWKGQYGMVLFGSELGVYTKSPDRVTPHYDCAADEDLLGMEMSVYKDEKLAFTHPYKMHWWTTGFKPGALDNYTDLTKPHSQLTVHFTVDLKSNEMAQLFADGLSKKGFTKVGFIDTVNFNKVDTYTIKGNRVEILWRNIVDTPGATNM